MKLISINALIYHHPVECLGIFKKAKESIKIVIPNHSIDFFQSDLIIEALRDAVARGVTVMVACHDPLDMGRSGIIRVSGTKVFEPKRPSRWLLIVVDAKHVLEEHSGRRVGMVVKNAKLLAERLDTTFDELVGV